MNWKSRLPKNDEIQKSSALICIMTFFVNKVQVQPSWRITYFFTVWACNSFRSVSGTGFTGPNPMVTLDSLSRTASGRWILTFHFWTSTSRTDLVTISPFRPVGPWAVPVLTTVAKCFRWISTAITWNHCALFRILKSGTCFSVF